MPSHDLHHELEAFEATVVSVLSAALAAAMNPSVAGGNHGAVYLEHEVLSWFKQLLGFPADAGGILVSGGSVGALTGLTVARHRACARRGWNIREAGLQADATHPHLVVYGTSQAHGCHQKAIELLGLGRQQFHTVACGEDLRMRPEALDAMLEADIRAGHVPMAVVATAGTVNTGVIDPLDAIADVCERHGVWLHIDGAYGALAILLPDYAPVLFPLARADSLALDPHKWLYVPVDAGLVLVKDARAMRVRSVSCLRICARTARLIRSNASRAACQSPRRSAARPTSTLSIGLIGVTRSRRVS